MIICRETVKIDGVTINRMDVVDAGPGQYQFTPYEDQGVFYLQYRGLLRQVFEESVMTVTIESIH